MGKNPKKVKYNFCPSSKAAFPKILVCLGVWKILDGDEGRVFTFVCMNLKKMKVKWAFQKRGKPQKFFVLDSIYLPKKMALGCISQSRFV